MGSRSRSSLLISRRRHQIRIKSEIFVGCYSFLGTHPHLILFRPLCPVAIPLTSTKNSPTWRDPANLSLNMPAPTDIFTLASSAVPQPGSKDAMPSNLPPRPPSPKPRIPSPPHPPPQPTSQKPRISACVTERPFPSSFMPAKVPQHIGLIVGFRSQESVRSNPCGLPGGGVIPNASRDVAFRGLVPGRWLTEIVSRLVLNR